VDNQTKVRVAVGCYSEPVGHAPTAHGRGVAIVDLDLVSREATTTFEYAAIANPAFLQPHPTLPVLYVLSEVWTGEPGSVTALRFGPGWTEPVTRTDLPSGGQVAAYVSVAGDCLVAANYGDGSLASFRLSREGDLLERVSLIQLSGSGPALDRQDGPHAHCLIPHPCNGFLYAADLGADLLLKLTLDPRTAELAVVAQTPLPPGSGPRHMVFTPSGDQVLVVEELSSTFAVFDVGPDGDLVLSQRLSMLPESFHGDSTGADIVMGPAGDTVFASNRGHDSVVRYNLGAAGWSPTSWTATGEVPRGLALSADGSTLVVANQQSDTLQVFAVTASELVELFSVPAATASVVRFLPG